MLDAIRYLVAGGISWRSMPVDFPGWDRVYAFFRRWRQHGLITEFHDRLRDRVRVREGREDGTDGRDHRRAVGEGRRDGTRRLTRLRRRQADQRAEAAHRDRLPRPTV
jgi:transposase